MRRYSAENKGVAYMRLVPAILIVVFLACPLLFLSFIAISVIFFRWNKESG